MAVLFVSDLHLDPARPAATQAFLDLLHGPAAGAERLYILGDLFEAWIGDDDPNPHHRKVCAAIAAYTATGTPTFFMPGNRDFLIGPDFIRATGMILLPDPTIIEAGGTSLLISHGDALCTDDHAYQRFRRISRHPWILKLYRALPFALRSKLVSTARTRSQVSTQAKPPEIMDVNQDAVERLMRTYGIATLLHGHTHRPGEHEFKLGDRGATRIVLGDWYTQAPVLVWDASGRRTEMLATATA